MKLAATIAALALCAGPLTPQDNNECAPQWNGTITALQRVYDCGQLAMARKVAKSIEDAGFQKVAKSLSTITLGRYVSLRCSEVDKIVGPR
jgi:hypothetical protein